VTVVLVVAIPATSKAAVTARTKCRVIRFVDCTIEDTKLRKEEKEEKEKGRES
jgi:hypothetical protein